MIEQELAKTNRGLIALTVELERNREKMEAMAERQLLQAAQLATVGELAASIAHELNNPLAIITLRVESLLEGTPADNPDRVALELIEQQVERMGNLVSNPLQFSRRPGHQISTVDIAADIEGTLNLIHRHLHNHAISVVREFASDLPWIQADRNQLRQLFLNLFNNASDAMPDGGTLTIRVYRSQGTLPAP